MALSNFDKWIEKVVQATHHKGDDRYGKPRGMNRSVFIYLDYISQKRMFCLNLLIITDILGWKAYHRRFLLKILQ